MWWEALSLVVIYKLCGMLFNLDFGVFTMAEAAGGRGRRRRRLLRVLGAGERRQHSGRDDRARQHAASAEYVLQSGAGAVRPLPAAAGRLQRRLGPPAASARRRDVDHQVDHRPNRTSYDGGACAAASDDDDDFRR